MRGTGALSLAVLLLLAVSATAGPVDSVLVVDPSFATAPDWIPALLADLESDLGTTFAVLLPVDDAWVLAGSRLDGEGAWAAIASAVTVGGPAAGVDGWAGIVEAMSAFDPRATRRNAILITDGAREVWDAALDFDGLAAALGPPTYLNAIVDHGFADGSGETALGMRGVESWHADGAGGVVRHGDSTWPSTPTAGAAGVLGDYVHLALWTGGSAWDIGQASFPDDLVRSSFRRGFVDVKIGETGGGQTTPPGFEEDRNGSGAPVIPEPGTLALVGAGGLLLLLRRRRS